MKIINHLQELANTCLCESSTLAEFSMLQWDYSHFQDKDFELSRKNTLARQWKLLVIIMVDLNSDDILSILVALLYNSNVNINNGYL